MDKTKNCGKIKRTTDKWFELIDIPCNFSIPEDEVAFLHILVNYPAQPDIIIRPNQMGNEINIRPINEYTDFGKWQDLVFVIPGGENGLEVNNIKYIGDCGFKNSPVGLVLNNTNKLGYIDEIIVNSDPEPRKNEMIRPAPTGIVKKNNNYSLYSDEQHINFHSEDGQQKQFSIYTTSGRLIFTGNKAQVHFKVPGVGLYIVRVGTETRKIEVR